MYARFPVLITNCASHRSATRAHPLNTWSSRLRASALPPPFGPSVLGRSPLGTIKWLAGLHPHPHLQRRRGVQMPCGWSLIVAHNGAGGCARSVNKILEKQTQASLVLTPPVRFAVRSACLHRPPQFERHASHAGTPCSSPLFNII